MDEAKEEEVGGYVVGSDIGGGREVCVVGGPEGPGVDEL